MSDKILNAVNAYYTDKIKEHGVTPRGVDWNSTESQELRFGQLCKVIDGESNFSVLDYGCGYGAMLGYMERQYKDLRYTGFDISEEMIKNAIATHAANNNADWTTKLGESRGYDYTIASGIFNVREKFSDEEWQQYITDT